MVKRHPGIGQPLGPFRLVFGPTRPLPLTYVENCAEAFARVVGAESTFGKTYNVTDKEAVSAWRHQGRCLRELGERGWRVPVPYVAGLAAARCATWVSRWLYSGKGKLPGILMPNRFRARFRPLRFDSSSLPPAAGTHELYNYDEAWRRIKQPTRGGEAPSPAAAEATSELAGAGAGAAS